MSSIRLLWFSWPMSSSSVSLPSSASISRTFFVALAWPSPSKASTRRDWRSKTPRKLRPEPMGQFMG